MNEPESAPALDLAAAAAAGRRPVSGRRGWVADLGALVGAFGLGTVAWLTFQPITWIVVILIGGVIFRGHLLGAWLGFLAAASCVVIFDSMLAAGPPAEYSGLSGSIAVLGLFVVGFVTAVGLMAFELASVVAGGEWFAPRGAIGRVGAAIAAVIGIVAIGAAAATWIRLANEPAASSFALDLPEKWTRIAEPPFYRDPAYGEALTAVFGSDKRPTAGEPPDDPVVGVSVSRWAGTSGECLRGISGWPGVSSVLYESPIRSSGGVDLPAGPAYREVRAPEPAGTLLYAYAFTRTRSIGLVKEELCYAVVITLPPDSPVSESDAEAIIRSFRFR